MPGARPRVRPLELVVTCEHGGNRIPPPYRALFRRAAALLASHRGYDPGALTVARDFAQAFKAKLFYSTVSRLLVELNRSLGHRQSFSPLVPAGLRNELVERYYVPYRSQIEAHVAAAIGGGTRVIHLSCHTFTPRLSGVRRTTDIGLLYDPRRRTERRFCADWKRTLERGSGLAVKLNYPYRGFGDGFTSDLRRRFRERDYLSIELEVNQKFPRSDDAHWRHLRRVLVVSFAEVLKGIR
jgi:predicted N-formylglutamate amidohydrolase